MKIANLICVVLGVTVGCWIDNDVIAGLNFGAAAWNALVYLDQ